MLLNSDLRPSLESWIPAEPRTFSDTILRQEKEQVDEAIISLERLVQGRGKRRGRPPAWLKQAKDRRRRRRPAREKKAESSDE